MLQTSPAPTTRPLIEVRAIEKRFGTVVALDGVDLAFEPGELFCLLGASGCGKSTLLRIVAGLERPSAGRVLLDGQDWTEVPPHRRPFNMMFQSYALFPHMSVADNVAYGLRRGRMGRGEREGRVAELLRLVRLEGFDGRRPDRLSGGQRQRVALARALARRPRALLLDEPLAALDRALREETQGELRRIQRTLGTTFVMVTHDPGEAMTMADRIGVMERGRLVQVGPADEVYERPATRYAASLLGDVNLIAGRLIGREHDLDLVDTPHGVLRARSSSVQRSIGTSVVLAIRPERLRPGPLAEGPLVNAVAGRVGETTFLGDRLRVHAVTETGDLLRMVLPAGAPRPATGEAVDLAFAPDAATVLEA